jgi:hypothetical protein
VKLKASKNHGDDTSSFAATYKHHSPSSYSIYTHKMIVSVHAVVVESRAAQKYHLWPVRCSVGKCTMFHRSPLHPSSWLSTIVGGCCSCLTQLLLQSDRDEEPSVAHRSWWRGGCHHPSGQGTERCRCTVPSTPSTHELACKCCSLAVHWYQLNIIESAVDERVLKLDAVLQSALEFGASGLHIGSSHTHEMSNPYLTQQPTSCSLNDGSLIHNNKRDLWGLLEHIRWVHNIKSINQMPW